MATGTFYQYFRSKDDLIPALLQEDWQTVLYTAEKAAASDESFAGKLYAVCQALTRFQERYRCIFTNTLSFQGRRESERLCGKREELLSSEAAHGHLTLHASCRISAFF